MKKDFSFKIDYNNSLNKLESTENSDIENLQIKLDPVKIINVGNVDDKSSQGPASITPIVNHTDRLEQARLLEKEEGKSSQIR